MEKVRLGIDHLEGATSCSFCTETGYSQTADQDAEPGVIMPSSSDWASPIDPVKKKDGSLRFCVDYRELNSTTKADLFPLPRIDDLLGEFKFFPTLDL